MVPWSELQPWLEAPDDDQSLVTGLEERAVSFLERQTGGRFFRAKATTSEIVDGQGTRDLWLSDPPTQDPSEVLEVEEVGDTGTEIAAADDDGWERRGAKLVRKGGCVWEAGYEYHVTYERGYTADQNEPADLTDAPKDLRQAVIDLVALKYRQRGMEGTERGGFGDYSFTVGDVAQIPGLQDTIDDYSWVTVP